ncbi:MAG: MXAN_6640 family putative metalloprotease [Actinomycetota bacterium]
MRISKALVAATLALALLPATPAVSARRKADSTRKSLPALTPARADALTDALQDGDLSASEYALERARSLFRLRSVRGEFGAVARPDGRDATLILRDLAIRASSLDGAERAEAAAILARPDDGRGDGYGQPYKRNATVEVLCAPDPDVKVCVHYVPTGGGDSFNETLPTWAADTLAEMTTVWNREVVELAFNAPKSDNSSDPNGGDGRTDVYLANIGSDGVYGYCSSDDPELFKANGRKNVSSYCVLDNDYSTDEFPNLPPLENMQVTAAHEFFHASQFAYDIYEDSWFIEGTAAWVEDEVYDAVNDNYQYLMQSPASQPHRSVDLTNNGGKFMTRYGAWYFWRFLSESFSGTPGQSDASVIRRVWEQADGSAGAPDQYSLQAAETVAAQEGTNLTDVFADFAATAFVPETFFEEGAAYLSYLLTERDLDKPSREGRPPLKLNKKLSASAPKARKRVELDHLASAYFSFRPKGSVPDTSTVKLKVKGPALSRGTTATAIVMNVDGTADLTRITLDKLGDGSQTVSFSPATVRRVVLVATNASTKYKNCGSGSLLSCGGTAKHDDQKFVVKGILK